jgi:hypothetical protein
MTFFNTIILGFYEYVHKMSFLLYWGLFAISNAIGNFLEHKTSYFTFCFFRNLFLSRGRNALERSFVQCRRTIQVFLITLKGFGTELCGQYLHSWHKAVTENIHQDVKKTFHICVKVQHLSSIRDLAYAISSVFLGEHSRINSTKFPASGAGNLSEPWLMSKGKECAESFAPRKFENLCLC